MAKQWAVVFPGQGSQSRGMLAELAEQYAIIQETFAEASDILSYDLWDLVQLDSEQRLNQTCYTQPAVFTADVALWRCWQQQSDQIPNFVAGHSLGEYSALVCANALGFSQGVDLVANRAKFMQSAVPEGEGAMAAVIALDDKVLVTLCEEESFPHDMVMPANYNSIGQSVVAGHREAVLRLIDKAKTAGAKIAKLLPVSVPSHCSLMEPAAEQLAQCLQSVNITTPSIPVIHNCDVAAHTNPEDIKACLVKQLTMPVRWVETIQYVAAQGVVFMLECGPGKVLKGLNKRIEKMIPTLSLLTPEEIDQARAKQLEEIQ